uniref:Transcription factor TFIIIC triple barrel domain-containing protein n=1 Tax=Cyprinus carpio TaxID=7962 RepID=A0A8C2JIG6_CYPCA
ATYLYETEILVVSGMISSDLICSRQGACKIVGRYLFAGEYEDAIGTCVIFEEDGAGSNSALKYKCHAMKKLMLQRTFLSERKEDEPVSGRIEVVWFCDHNTPQTSSNAEHILAQVRAADRG